MLMTLGRVAPRNSWLVITWSNFGTFHLFFTLEEIASCEDIQCRSSDFDRTRTLLTELKRFWSNSNTFDWTLLIECFWLNAFLKAFDWMLLIERYRLNASDWTLSIECFRYILDVRTTGNFFHCVHMKCTKFCSSVQAVTNQSAVSLGFSVSATQMILKRNLFHIRGKEVPTLKIKAKGCRQI